MNHLPRSPFDRVGCAVVVMVLGLSALLPARAISVVPPSFAELVAGATEIVRVEVLDVSSRFDRPSPDSSIHTYVRCRVLRAMKGTADETITLRLLGGRVGDTVIEIPDMPVFVVGQKYIVFVAQNGRAFCPLVGVMHGNYPLITLTSGGADERVLRDNREPLRSVAGVGEAMADRVGAGASPISTAMTVAEFETAILREMARAKQP